MDGAGDDPYVTYIGASKNPMSKKDIIIKEESEETEETEYADSDTESYRSYRRRRPRRSYSSTESEDDAPVKWSYNSAPKTNSKFSYRTTGVRGGKASVVPERPPVKPSRRPARVPESSEESEEVVVAQPEPVKPYTPEPVVEISQPAEDLAVVVEDPVEDRPIVGGPTTITCADGTNVVCASGTRDCFDGSEFYCGTPEPEPIVVGGE